MKKVKYFFQKTNTVWETTLSKFEAYVDLKLLCPDESFDEIVKEFFSTYPSFPNKLSKQEIETKMKEMGSDFEANSRQLEWKLVSDETSENIWIPDQEDSTISPFLRKSYLITDNTIDKRRKLLEKIDSDFKPFLQKENPAIKEILELNQNFFNWVSF